MKRITLRKFDSSLKRLGVVYIIFGLATISVPLYYYFSFHAPVTRSLEGKKLVEIRVVEAIFFLADLAFLVVAPICTLCIAGLGVGFLQLLRKRRQLNITEITEQEPDPNG